MKMVFKKRFRKNLQKLSKKNQNNVKIVLKTFIDSPRHKSLRRHKLKGKYTTYESIDVTGDIRIIIQPQTMEVIDICDIGTHSELY